MAFWMALIMSFAIHAAVAEVGSNLLRLEIDATVHTSPCHESDSAFVDMSKTVVPQLEACWGRCQMR